MVETSTEQRTQAGASSEAPAFVRPLYASEESMLLYRSLEARLDALEKRAIDHEQRFDTLQTWFWKRIWFLIDGWPWHDLNGVQKRRPWHRP